MKRIVILTLALMLMSSMAFAAGAQRQPGGKQENVVNVTTANQANVMAIGEDNKAHLGVVSNKGGEQSNVVNVTTVNRANVMAIGEGNEAKMGAVSNE